MAAKGLEGFRLILSDELVGGQKVQTFKQVPTSLDQVISLLVSHLGFQELCFKKGLQQVPKAASEAVRFQGVDGGRRVPISSDANLASFLLSVQKSPLPTIEARLAAARPSAAPVSPKGSDSSRPKGRQARDDVELDEDEKSQVQRTCHRLERRVDEVERLFVMGQEETKRLLDFFQKEMLGSQDKVVRQIQAQLEALKQQDEQTLESLEGVKNHLAAVEKQSNKGHEELGAQHQQFSDKVEHELEKLRIEINLRKIEDKRLDEQANKTRAEHFKVLVDHSDELKRLESVKVDQKTWQKHETEMTERITEEIANLVDRLMTDEQEYRFEISEVQAGLDKAKEELAADAARQVEKIDQELRREVEELSSEAKAMVTQLGVELNTKVDQLAAEILAKVEAEVQELSDKNSKLSDFTDERFANVEHDLNLKDTAANNRIDELTSKADGAFKSHSDRIDENARMDRARMGCIERDVSETVTKIRSECRAEIERVRIHYEQESARLDADMADLHTKHDVTKQEINFFQSRLQEQREWTGRMLAEAATATKASALDAQEGLTAVTKMLHALRDDSIGFKEKMAKYISALQHSSDGHGDAINSLTTHRVRLRSDLDGLINEFKAYTSDMDGWADDVRVKVERLFKALVPVGQS